MSEQTGKIEIVLKSDLCAGSGYSHAGIIDNDSCYDEHGLPFIPTKRLKGCMREVAETILIGYKIPPSNGSSEEVEIDDTLIQTMFGRRGSDKAGAVEFGNAYLDGQESLKKALERKKTILAKKKEQLSFYLPGNIIEQFTRVIGQTRLEDGVARKRSLRFTRVVNQKNPIKDAKETDSVVFHADIKVNADSDPEKEKIFQALEVIAKATRHIGLHRNRGRGNVRCVLLKRDDNQKENSREQGMSSNADENFRDCIESTELNNSWHRIMFAVENVAPLMLCTERENESETYISGRSVLGALAARYLHEKGKSAADTDEFHDLFLNGTTCYTNLYPIAEGKRYYPAPAYMNKLKKSDKIVFTLQDILPVPERIRDKNYRYDQGNQFKKLTGKYALPQGDILEVDKDIVYHHRHHARTAGQEDARLYSMEVVRTGQKYAGVILIKNDGKAEEYKKTIIGLLCEGDLFFGKSRSAQYGRCRLIKAPSPDEGKKTESLEKDDWMVVTFLSDGLFVNDDGSYTVFEDEIRKVIKEELEKIGIETQDVISKVSGADEEATSAPYLSIIQTTLSTGYHSAWNLRKPATPAIKAGSCMVFKVADASQWKNNGSTDMFFIGERNQEGYGQVRIERADKYGYEKSYKLCVNQANDNSSDNREITETEENSNAQGDCMLQHLVTPIIVSAAVDEFINQKTKEINQKTKESSINVSNSAAARFSLMLRESIEENETADAIFEDFAKRIESVRKESTKEEGRKLLAVFGEAFGEKSDSEEEDCSNAKKEKQWTLSANRVFSEPNKQALKDLGVCDDTIRELEKEQWMACMNALLVDRKYNGSAVE